LNGSTFGQAFSEQDVGDLKLQDGSHVAAIGGGPAGSFFSYFTLDLANRMGLEIDVDIYEPRDFARPGPRGCNMCGGIISESLVQLLSTEGIDLPDTVVQRGIESYFLHTDVGDVRIETPIHEKRIAAVHRGSGPKDIKEIKWGSFDDHLQKLAVKKGANVIRERVEGIAWTNGRLQVRTPSAASNTYDLVAVSVGINSPALRLFQELGSGYQPPQTTKTAIREYYLGEETISKLLGNSMHVFLLDIPRLEFAAIIPKGDYVSLCLLGEEIDRELIESFLRSPAVRDCMPPQVWEGQASCQCAPRINVQGAIRPFGDRLVYIGDSGVTRLYKDGIGAAYRTAKAAATTAVFHGISASDFQQHFWPACRRLTVDNAMGKLVFWVTRQIQHYRFARRAVLRMTMNEQRKAGARRPMSMVLWDTFTGSAPYRDILGRALHPAFLVRFLWENIVGTATELRYLPQAIRLRPTS